MGSHKQFLEPLLALPDMRRAGIIRSIGEPQRNVAAAETRCDPDAVSGVLERARSHGRIRIPERPVFVFLVLKKVGIDRAGPHAVVRREFLNLLYTFDPARKIPQNVQCDCGTGSGQLVDLAGITELLFRGGSGSGLDELAETRSGVGKTPGGNLDAKLVQGSRDLVGLG